jgi:hypothetical protein
MGRRLVAGTVVGQDERKIDRMFVCIRKKIPLLLRLVMDFVGTGAEAAEMLWKVVGRGMRRRLLDR